MADKSVTATGMSDVSLDDKYDLGKTRVFLTGTQAIARLLLMQKHQVLSDAAAIAVRATAINAVAVRGRKMAAHSRRLMPRKVIWSLLRMPRRKEAHVLSTTSLLMKIARPMTSRWIWRSTAIWRLTRQQP
jgi:hypothetical protein